MQWVNIASVRQKCQVIKASSTHDSVTHPSQCVIDQKKETLWISGQGLPQEIVLNLEKVTYQYQNITGIAFACSHDYDTNPKVIQIWVSKNEESAEISEYVLWEEIFMRKRRGRQMFSLSSPIPQSQRILKIKITQTFGEYSTYLNQIELLAEPDPQSSQSLFNQEEWNKLSQSPINPSAIQKNRYLRNKHSDRHSPLDLLNEDMISDKFQSKQSDMEPDQSYESNAALLAVSKNVLIMEDKIEDLNRKVEVLQKRINFSYQNFEAKILAKVKELVNEKFERQSLKESTEMPRRLKSCKDLATSRTMNIKKSMDKQKKQKKQKKMVDLVAQLSGKLREREKLAKRLQKRIKHQKPRSQYYD